MTNLHTLPPEVITQIFTFLAEDWSPIPLTHVNSRLRDIGIHSPELWTRIHSVQVVRKEVEYDRIRHFLQRSGNRGIDTSFFVDGPYCYSPAAAEIFMLCLPRIEKLTLSGCSLGLFMTCFLVFAPRLIYLDISELFDADGLPEGSLVQTAPNLSTLKMRSPGPKDLKLLSNIQGSLRCLDLWIDRGAQPDSLSSLIEVIGNQASSLVELKLCLPDNFLLHPDDNEFMRDSPCVEIIGLQCLDVETPSTRFLRKITTPALGTLSLFVYNDDRDGDNFEMNPSDLPCLLSFIITHSKSLTHIRLTSPSNWPVRGPGEDEARILLASLPRRVTFPRLRGLTLNPCFGERQLFETITSTTLETLFLQLSSASGLSWASLLWFIHYNSLSLKSIRIWHEGEDKVGVQAFGRGDTGDIPSLLLPRLERLHLDCRGGGIILAYIHSAPLLKSLKICSPTPSKSFNVSHGRIREFPSLRAVHLMHHLELLRLIEAPALTDVVLGMAASQNGRILDTGHEWVLLDFFRRHALSIVTLSTTGVDIIPPHDIPSSLILDSPDLKHVQSHKVDFPLLEILDIRSDDGLIPYIVGTPKLREITLWSACRLLLSKAGDIGAEGWPPPVYSDLSTFAPPKTLEITNSPTQDALDHIRNLFAIANNVSRLVISNVLPNTDRTEPGYDVVDVSISIMSLLETPSLLPCLVDLNILGPPKELETSFYASLRALVSARLGAAQQGLSLLKPLEILTVRSTASIMAEIRSWLEANVPETLFTTTQYHKLSRSEARLHQATSMSNNSS